MLEEEGIRDYTDSLNNPSNSVYLQQLLEDNKKWVNNLSGIKSQGKKRTELIDGQNPKIIVLTCADSRVIPEYIFDAEIGDLFVIRVAGNVMSSEIIASIEFAFSELNSELLCIIGHENCGAIQTKLRLRNSSAASKNLNTLLDKIHIEKGISVTENVIHNIKSQMDTIKHKSDIVSTKLKDASIDIVGMYYQLTSGKISLVSID